MPSSLLLNHRTAAVPAGARPGPHVHAFHRRLPGYAPTPLRDMPALAAEAGVRRVLVKDESSRMGLPAFKILGASWATYRVLCERLGGEPEWATLDDLAAVVAERLGPLRLVAATDGNHGRAVARMARLLGLRSTIVVPDGTAEARIGAITSEGAEVVVSPGTYDDAVTLSAGMAGDRDLIISDTSWPGYEDPPRWVIEGYATIFHEVDEQAGAAVDVAVVPIGVGALAAAAARHLAGPARLAGVEPVAAACVLESARAGEITEVPGPHGSIMSGLNAGLPSLVAWPLVSGGFDLFSAAED
ncbi:MAG TPA: pyridoxal-phosphate dependent enzyme, partial [Acidimicrobiales bacterium]|nr:pyridoxal-phosphate dependent enzyme [Acidimicrobiales bacterium]